MADLAAKWAGTRSEEYRRLTEYVGARSSLTTTEKDTIVGAINEIRARMADLCLAAAGLVIGTGSKAKVLITNTVTYLIGGVFCSKTTAEIAFTETTHDIAPNASTVQEAVYTMSLQAGGTATLTMGDIATGAAAAVVPAAPAGEAVIGHVRIAVDAGATPFDAGTDLLDAGHLTVTYTDVAFIE